MAYVITSLLGRDLAVRDQPLHDRPHRGRVRPERSRDLLAALAVIGAHIGQEGAGLVVDLGGRAGICALR